VTSVASSREGSLRHLFLHCFALADQAGEARQKVLQDMELWIEIRRRVLTGELSRRQAVKDYQLNYRTIQKIVGHVEAPADARMQN
jgi:hypothetical protein